MIVNLAGCNQCNKCPGSQGRNDFFKKIEELTRVPDSRVKPEDKESFKIIIDLLVHRKDRNLIKVCIGVLVRRGFRYNQYNFEDYTDLILKSNRYCCRKTKLLIEYVHFLVYFHRRSSELFSRALDNQLTGVITKLCVKISASKILQFQDESPKEVAVIMEHLQAKPIEASLKSNASFVIEHLRDLYYYRRAQDIRDKHGLERIISYAYCYQHHGDIDNLVAQLNNHEPLEFFVQSYNLTVLDKSLVHQMYATLQSYDDIVSLYTRTANFRSAFASRDLNRDHSRAFVNAFHRVSRHRATWKQAMLLFLVGLNTPERWHLPNTDFDLLPVEHLNLYLHYLALYSQATLTRNTALVMDGSILNNFRRLPGMVDNLIRRGADVNFVVDYHDAARELVLDIYPQITDPDANYDQTLRQVSTAASLMRLIIHRETLSFGDWLYRLCCPITLHRRKFVNDKYRLGKLQCLAAMAIPRSTDSSRIPGKLELFVSIHQDYAEALRSF